MAEISDKTVQRILWVIGYGYSVDYLNLLIPEDQLQDAIEMYNELMQIRNGDVAELTINNSKEGVL